MKVPADGLGLRKQSGRHLLLCGACLLMSGAAAGAERTPGSAELSSAAGGSPAGLAAQERARALATDLVRGVIDVQLRQLEENGLSDRPIHADIQALRGVVAGLVQHDMHDVVQLLTRAEEATPAERPALVAEARSRARGIVTRLAAERQQILRRLKQATIVAQTRAIIGQQQRLLTTTESLSALADGRREQTLLAAIDEERNVKTLVAALAAALDDVSNWGGEVGATSLAGLRVLRKEGVPDAVAAAESRLEQADPSGAGAAQRRVIAGLEAVLAALERTRPADAAAGKDAAALAGKAAEIRREMAKAPLTDQSVEKLLAEQSALQEALVELANELRGEPAVAGLVEKAKEAAIEAAAGLLEGDQRQAVTEQAEVAERLAELAARLEAGQPDTAPASAEDFAERAAELMDVLRDVEKFASRQDEIDRMAGEQPLAAAAAEGQLSAEIARLVEDRTGAKPPDDAGADERPELPLAVEQRIAAAADAAAEVAQASTPQAARSAIREATDAMRAAAQEIARAVADAKRAELAARAGELARAAEVAERAAAAERGIAQEATRAMEQARAGDPGKGADPSAAGERATGPKSDDHGQRPDALVKRQTEVALVADKVADAVDALAPEAARMIAEAQASMQAAREQLEARAAAARRLTDAQQALEQAVAERAAAGNGLSEKTAPGREEAGKAAESAAEKAAGRPAPGEMATADKPPSAPKAAGETAARAAGTNEPNADIPVPAATQPALGEVVEAAARAAESLALAAAAMRADAKQTAEEAAEQAAGPGQATGPGQAKANPGGQPADQALAKKKQDALEAKAKDLARAAQMIDRAAALERGIADRARQAAEMANTGSPRPNEGAPSESRQAEAQLAGSLAAKQAEVAAIAETVEDAVEGLSPEAAQRMAAAQAAIEAARRQFDAQAREDRAGPTPSAEMKAGSDQVAGGRQDAQQRAGKDEPKREPQSPAADGRSDAPPGERVAAAVPAASEPSGAEKAATEKLAAERATAAKAAEAAAQEAVRAAESLAQAAEQMRQKAKQAADELARVAAGQAEEAGKARAAAQDALAARSQDSPPAAAGAEGQANQPPTPASDPVRRLERDAEAFAVRETALARDRIVAEEIAAAIREQSAAREAVAASAAALESLPGDAAAGVEREQAAAALADAKDRFAEAQRDIGERVAAALEQQEIGNEPLRESLEAASPRDDLGTGFLPKSPEATADMIAGERANAAAARVLAATGDSGYVPDQDKAGEPTGAEQAGSRRADTGQTAPPQAQSRQSEPPPSDSENPASEQAGAPAAGSRQASNQQPMNQDRRESQGAKSPSNEQPSSEQANSGRDGAARDDDPLREIAAVDRRSDPGSRGGDADAVERSFERDAWFAKLPPEVRKAIRAGGQRRAPRGYEAKMDRYFKNIE